MALAEAVELLDQGQYGDALLMIREADRLAEELIASSK